MSDDTIHRFFDVACDIAQCSHYNRCRGDCPFLDSSTNSTPQPGFIGRKYSGLVIVGANPGIPNVSPFIEREPEYVRHIQNFARRRDFELFNRYLDYAADYMGTWRNNLANQSFRKLLGYDIEEIAYINVVKCRSNPVGSNPFTSVGEPVTRRCFNSHTARQLAVLKPKWIVAHWKPIPRTLAALGYDFPKAIPAYSGAYHLPLEKRVSELVSFFRELRNS